MWICKILIIFGSCCLERMQVIILYNRMTYNGMRWGSKRPINVRCYEKDNCGKPFLCAFINYKGNYPITENRIHLQNTAFMSFTLSILLILYILNFLDDFEGLILPLNSHYVFINIFHSLFTMQTFLIF